LLKIDTDGFDCQIILSSLPLLAEMRPVLFFEYDPNLFRDKQPDGFVVFERLREIGYGHFLFYDNEGDYLALTKADDTRLLRDLDGYFRGRQSEFYADVCAVQAVDLDLAERIREWELTSARLGVSER